MVQTAYVTIISLDDHVPTLEEQIIDGGRSIAAAETGLPHSLDTSATRISVTSGHRILGKTAPSERTI